MSGAEKSDGSSCETPLSIPVAFLSFITIGIDCEMLRDSREEHKASPHFSGFQLTNLFFWLSVVDKLQSKKGVVIIILLINNKYDTNFGFVVAPRVATGHKLFIIPNNKKSQKQHNKAKE